MNSSKTCLLAGALFGASGVVLGAWGAHGLPARLGDADVGAWDTAVLYQLIHSVALILVGILVQLQVRPGQTSGSIGLFVAAGWAMIAGVSLFCGSIYLLVLGGPSWLGPVTPLGGIAFITGWLLLLIAAGRQR